MPCRPGIPQPAALHGRANHEQREAYRHTLGVCAHRSRISAAYIPSNVTADSSSASTGRGGPVSSTTMCDYQITVRFLLTGHNSTGSINSRKCPTKDREAAHLRDSQTRKHEKEGRRARYQAPANIHCFRCSERSGDSALALVSSIAKKLRRRDGDRGQGRRVSADRLHEFVFPQWSRQVARASHQRAAAALRSFPSFGRYRPPRGVPCGNQDLHHRSVNKTRKVMTAV
jgi:hypothetical protein